MYGLNTVEVTIVCGTQLQISKIDMDFNEALCASNLEQKYYAGCEKHDVEQNKSYMMQGPHFMHNWEDFK